jgi:hypothetical protein
VSSLDPAGSTDGQVVQRIAGQWAPGPAPSSLPTPTEIAVAGPVSIARAQWQKFVNRYDGPMQFDFPPVGAPPQLGDVLSIACGKFASSAKVVTLNPNGQVIVGISGSLLIRQKNVSLDFQFTSDGWVRV